MDVSMDVLGNISVHLDPRVFRIETRIAEHDQSMNVYHIIHRGDWPGVRKAIAQLHTRT